MYMPSHYPFYITAITDLSDRSDWQSSYLKAYEKEYHTLNSHWNAIKAIMSGISLFALTIFASILIATAKTDRTLAIATTILVAAIGTTASICAAIYYGTLSDENEKNLRALPHNFPLRFEVYFNTKTLESMKKNETEET